MCIKKSNLYCNEYCTFLIKLVIHIKLHYFVTYPFTFDFGFRHFNFLVNMRVIVCLVVQQTKIVKYNIIVNRVVPICPIQKLNNTLNSLFERVS